MTYEEAINILENTKVMVLKGSVNELQKASCMAIEVLEKQIPKRPLYDKFEDNGFDEIIPYKATCPNCGEEFEFGTWNEEENHHCVCGQCMDWGE